MKVRKRTRSGKSTKHTVNQPLRVVAKTKEEITLSFEIEYHLTEFNLTLGKTEARSLAEQILQELKGE